MAVDPDNIQYTEEYYNSISISGTLKQRRRISSSGQISNANIPDDSEVGPNNIRYVNYLGKITKMTIDITSDIGDKSAVAAFNKKFPGSEPVLIDQEAKDNSDKLSATTQKALKNSNDACASAGSLGGLSDVLSDVGKELEEAAGSILGAVGEVAGVVNEAINAVGEAIAKVTELIAKAAGLIARLIAAGIGALAELIDTIINEASAFVENALNAVNDAVGEVAGAIADTVDAAVDAVGDAIGAAAGLIGDVVAAVAAGGCKETTAILTSLPAVPAGPAGAIQSKIKSNSPRQSRMLASDVDIQGNPRVRVVNFNIDKSLPFRDIQYKGVLTRMYYQNAADMNERFGIPEGLGSS